MRTSSLKVSPPCTKRCNRTLTSSLCAHSCVLDGWLLPWNDLASGEHRKLLLFSVLRASQVERQLLLPSSVPGDKVKIIALARKWQEGLKPFAYPASDHDQGFRFQPSFTRCASPLLR